MAITGADVALWEHLRAIGAVPPSPAVVEIGQANWYGDVPSPFALPGDPPPVTPEDRFREAEVFWAMTLGFRSLDAIDPHGQPGRCTPHDLNQPIPRAWEHRFDVLVNTGTAEHVFNQHRFWANCHGLTRPGGLMVHGAPWTGWINHGLYSYQPGFFLDLAEANGYETLAFWATSISPTRVRPVFQQEGENTLILEPGQDTMLHVAWRKHSSAPFVAPWQSCYAPEPRGWASVPGWLTPAEGAALQALARGKLVLELGAWKGRSTCCLAEVATAVRSVDHFRGDGEAGREDTHGNWLANVEAQGHRDKVRGATLTFAEAASLMPESAYDLVYVDGDHSEAGTEEATRLALFCVRHGGAVALHDWNRASVREGARRAGLTRPPDGAAGALAWWEGVTRE